MSEHITSFVASHAGESAIVFGTGPSLDRYDGRFNDQCVLIGTNEIIYYPVLMDYYFIGDAGSSSRGYLSDPGAYDVYTPRLAKFYRLQDMQALLRCNPMPLGKAGVIYYEAKQHQKIGGSRFPKKIPPIKDAYSISFEALQFAIMAGFQRIYLIGHDCDYTHGSFKTENVGKGPPRHVRRIIESWRQFEQFVSHGYPDVELINVNPVQMRHFKLLEIK